MYSSIKFIQWLCSLYRTTAILVFNNQHTWEHLVRFNPCRFRRSTKKHLKNSPSIHWNFHWGDPWSMVLANWNSVCFRIAQYESLDNFNKSERQLSAINNFTKGYLMIFFSNCLYAHWSYKLGVPVLEAKKLIDDQEILLNAKDVFFKGFHTVIEIKFNIQKINI